MHKASRIHYLFGAIFCFCFRVVTAMRSYGKNHGMPPSALAPLLGYMEEQVKRRYAVIDAKRKVAHFLHLPLVQLPGADET
jgi:hypothetical protein